MPNQRHESHHRSCNLRYGTHGYLCVLPLVTLIDGFSQLGYCMLHSLGSIKIELICFQDFGSGRSLESRHCDFKRQCNWILKSQCLLSKDRCQRQQAEALLKTNSSIFYISIHFVGMQLT